MGKSSLIYRNTTPLCMLASGLLVCSESGKVMVLDGDTILSQHRIPISSKEKFWGKIPFFYRLFRLGIRAAEAIDDYHFLYSIGNMLYEMDLKTGLVSNGYFCGNGIRPLSFTTVRGVQDFDDGIYFGGYLGNPRKEPVSIYHRIGVDQWEVVYTFTQGMINHVHNIVADPYRNCLWVFTGDFDDAAAIWKVTENFKKVETFVYNNQRYRGCVAYALPEGLLYATDAPFADDYIYLLQPETMKLKELSPIHGSCIYGCKWKDNFVFSSTVEGDGRNTSRIEFLLGRKRGAGIKDEYVHMYMGNLKEGFREIYKDRKDNLPYYTFQFGVFKFPSGMNNGDSLYFQPIATKKNDLCLMAYSE